MKTSSSLVVLALAASITLSSCGTSEPSAPAASTASASTAPATNAEGDVTNPNQAVNRTHLSKAAAKIQNGVTTRRDVQNKLGIFNKKEGQDATGRKTVTWTLKQTKGTAKSFIPGSAFIPGAMITYYQSITLVLDANDVVVSHSFLETTKEKTGLGFSYGS